MATISAWAVGSLAVVTAFHPRLIIRPSLTTSAPNGPPLPSRIFSTERRIASCMKDSFTTTSELLNNHHEEKQQNKHPKKNTCNARTPGVSEIQCVALITSNLALATRAPEGTK